MPQRIPVDLIHLLVMHGLDPRIQHLRQILCGRWTRGWRQWLGECADSNRLGSAV